MAESGPITVDLGFAGGTANVPGEILDFSRNVADGVQRNVAREISSLPLGQRTKLGVFALPHGQGAHPGFGVSSTHGSQDFFLFGGENPSCVVTRSMSVRDSWAAQLAGGWHPWWAEEAATATHILGLCRFYAAYGLPGSQVSEWMESGGVVFAAGNTLSSEAMRETRELTRAERRGVFGLGAGQVQLPAAAEACLAGRMEDCGSVLTSELSRLDRTSSASPLQGSHPELIYSQKKYTPPSETGLLGYGSQLVADIEAEFGPERFQDFWSSNQPLDVAFATAFGLPLGEWTHSWLATRFSPNQLGPGLSWETFIITLGFISFCVSIVFAAARKRQVA